MPNRGQVGKRRKLLIFVAVLTRTAHVCLRGVEGTVATAQSIVPRNKIVQPGQHVGLLFMELEIDEVLLDEMIGPPIEIVRRSLQIESLNEPGIDRLRS
jgi:hypothetical protein